MSHFAVGPSRQPAKLSPGRDPDLTSVTAKVDTNGRDPDLTSVTAKVDSKGRDPDLTSVTAIVDRKGRDPDLTQVRPNLDSRSRDPDLTHVRPKVDNKGRDLRRRMPGPMIRTGHSPAVGRLEARSPLGTLEQRLVEQVGSPDPSSPESTIFPESLYAQSSIECMTSQRSVLPEHAEEERVPDLSEPVLNNNPQPTPVENLPERKKGWQQTDSIRKG